MRQLVRALWSRSSRVKPRILVVADKYETALGVADLIEKGECIPHFLSVAELDKAGAVDPLPGAVLLLPQLSSEEKMAACALLRSMDAYRSIPIAAVMTLAEGTVAPSADVVIRPPASLKEAIAQIKRAVGGSTSSR